MFVILTSKPGKFTTEFNGGLRPVEAYDYMFYGRMAAHFVIAELVDPNARIRVVESGSGSVSDVPTKFLQKFETVDGALAELQQLVSFGRLDTALNKVTAQ